MLSGVNNMQDINIEIKINLEEGEVIICQKGISDCCIYFISYLNELSKCISDYVEKFL